MKTQSMIASDTFIANIMSRKSAKSGSAALRLLRIFTIVIQSSVRSSEQKHPDDDYPEKDETVYGASIADIDKRLQEECGEFLRPTEILTALRFSVEAGFAQEVPDSDPVRFISTEKGKNEFINLTMPYTTHKKKEVVAK